MSKLMRSVNCDKCGERVKVSTIHILAMPDGTKKIFCKHCYRELVNALYESYMKGKEQAEKATDAQPVEIDAAE